MGVLTRPPLPPAPAVAWTAWTTGATSASSWPRGAPRSPREQAGLPAGGGRRRVPGLRREEVAVLAGVSTDWYVAAGEGPHRRRLRGGPRRRRPAPCNSTRPNAPTSSTWPAPPPADPRAAPRRARGRAGRASSAILDAMTDRAGASSATAAWTSSPPTPSAAPCTRPLFDDPVRSRPTSPASTSSTRARADFYPEWDEAANTTVALLRTEAGRAPARPRADRPGRRTRHPQRGVPHPLGGAQRPPAPHRDQALPPPRRRRHRPRLRRHGAARPSPA